MKKPLDRVIHTLAGWPLKISAKYHQIGGSWIYPMKDEKTGEDLVSIGFVLDLDYADATTSAHDLLQQFKTHPMVRDILEGGERVSWGAKAIPAGGYWAMPKLSAPGAVLCGDAAGMVNLAALKGVHLRDQVGDARRRVDLRLAEEGANDFSAYEEAIADSIVGKELYEQRNTRQPFQKGLIKGGPLVNLMIATKGRFPGGRWKIHRNDAQPMFIGKTKDGYPTPDGKYTFDKLSSVFISGNATRDDAPNHIRVQKRVPREIAETWAWMCPAGVYEIPEDAPASGEVDVIVNYTNCVQCGAITAKGGRLTTPRAATARSTRTPEPGRPADTPGWIRTSDHRIRSPALCPLSYGGEPARLRPRGASPIASLTMPTVERRRDASFNYERAGAGEPLLLIQGMSATHIAWGGPFSSLLEESFDCIAFDNRGIGLSGPVTEPFTIAEMAADALGLLDALEIESAHVLGISMGGMIAQELALAHPERLRSLTLGCTYCGGEGSQLMDPADFQGLVEAMASGDPDRVLPGDVGAEPLPRLPRRREPLRRVHRDGAKRCPRRARRSACRCRRSSPTTPAPDLPSLAPPTLVIHGTEDRVLRRRQRPHDRLAPPRRPAGDPRGRRPHVLVGAARALRRAGPRARAGAGLSADRLSLHLPPPATSAQPAGSSLPSTLKT